MKIKDLVKFELSVLIEKNKSMNERKLKTEIKKLLSKNSQMREINFVQMKKNEIEVFMLIFAQKCN